MKFTVITIAYNEEKNIEATMQSVLVQDHKALEYLVIDGGSSDHTVETAERLAAASGRDVKIYSEPDFGIYNAMNRGIMRASGEYVIFMNAGDLFWNGMVLSEMAEQIRPDGEAVYYGNACLMKNGRVQFIQDIGRQERSIYSAFMKGHMPAHQSIAVPLRILKESPFNERYRIRADYEWLLRRYKEGVRFVSLDMMVCRYDNSGISSRSKLKKAQYQETKVIRRKYYPITGRLYEMFGM